MPKEKGTHLSGPLRMYSANGTLGRSDSVTVTALAAGAEETYTITDADAKLGDIIVASPAAGVEAGWGITKAWVSADNTIKISASNFSGSGLTGGSLTIHYAILK